MWTAWLLLTLNGLFFTLRLAGNTGSFPRALTREEEQDCLERMAKGDSDARDMLIEHNLRLVAHIVNKEQSKRKKPAAHYWQNNFGKTLGVTCRILYFLISCGIMGFSLQMLHMGRLKLLIQGDNRHVICKTCHSSY